MIFATRMSSLIAFDASSGGDSLAIEFRLFFLLESFLMYTCERKSS